MRPSRAWRCGSVSDRGGEAPAPGLATTAPGRADGGPAGRAVAGGTGACVAAGAATSAGFAGALAGRPPAAGAVLPSPGGTGAVPCPPSSASGADAAAARWTARWLAFGHSSASICGHQDLLPGPDTLVRDDGRSTGQRTQQSNSRRLLESLEQSIDIIDVFALGQHRRGEPLLFAPHRTPFIAPPTAPPYSQPYRKAGIGWQRRADRTSQAACPSCRRVSGRERCTRRTSYAAD